MTLSNTEIEVEGDYFPGIAATTQGLPEDCGPGEGAYFEVEDVRVGAESIYDLLVEMRMLVVKTLGNGEEQRKWAPALQVLEGLAFDKLQNNSPESDFDEGNEDE
jgi:hypothetical protein